MHGVWVLLAVAGWIVALAVAVDGLRRRRAYRAVVAENAARLRNEQYEREQRAVLLERVRIARELHDVVAHHMSVVAVQANLARHVLTSDPAAAQTSLRAVAEAGADALDEVRRLVRVLRAGPDRAGDDVEASTPGLDDLAVMIERVGLAGVAIEFTVSGQARPLPAGVGLCVYRAVQESLTNVIKHARSARVHVHLTYGGDRVGVRVTNDARGERPGRAVAALGGDGRGLAGMRERARLYGGEVRAGRLPEGGFEVLLTLPVRPADTPDPAPGRSAG